MTFLIGFGLGFLSCLLTIGILSMIDTLKTYNDEYKNEIVYYDNK